jgi:hypothetical protein
MRRFSELLTDAGAKNEPNVVFNIGSGIQQFARQVVRVQQAVDAAFPNVATAHSFYYWRPGDRVPSIGQRVLIGVAAAYSHSDLQLLDSVSEEWSSSGSGITVDVFNISDCSLQDDFELYIPGIGPVFQTPVVGLWADGVLVRKGTGKNAVDILKSLFSGLQQ